VFIGLISVSLAFLHDESQAILLFLGKNGTFGVPGEALAGTWDMGQNTGWFFRKKRDIWRPRGSVSRDVGHGSKYGMVGNPITDFHETWHKYVNHGAHESFHSEVLKFFH